MKKWILFAKLLPFVGIGWLTLQITYADPSIVSFNEFARLQGITPEALRLGLEAYQCAKEHGEIHNPILTIVDYSKPSTQKRMWIINPEQGRVLYKLYVTHGKNSGNLYATRFSNKVNSLESSLGVFVTENTYDGDYGYSLVLHGLEKGLNDNAEKRHIIVHQAWYATGKIVQRYDTLGRSAGCLAIDPGVANGVINTIKDGSLVFSYAPSEQHDRYVLGCE